MKKGIIVAVLISLFSIVALAENEEAYFHGGKSAETIRKELIKEMNLSQDQKDKIKTLTEETKTNIKDLSDQNPSREDFISGMKDIKIEQKDKLNKILNSKQQKILETRMSGMEKRKADFEKKLDLTDEQKDQISLIRDNYYKQIQGLKYQGLTENQQTEAMKKLFKEEVKEKNAVLTDKQKTFLKSSMNQMR